MKTPSKTPSNVKDYAPKLPPGAYQVPGSRAVKALKGERDPGVVTIDKNFVSSPLGGKELVVGRSALHVKDNRTIDKR
jgi:hypothetical protein